MSSCRRTQKLILTTHVENLDLLKSCNSSERYLEARALSGTGYSGAFLRRSSEPGSSSVSWGLRRKSVTDRHTAARINNIETYACSSEGPVRC